ncbi:type IV pilus modification protein PilV [Shewanella sedimentimangrovi]|uniref:Type IV pilus modification protein PilV n=1 Tax=Shewanella sedimentimangrovi TaxID=2814293 RepID=A0ABX7R2N4_9GAMM|nr:type IV pilus modification protein PilV [Shewanella sedimentimangrovi]QSX38086.1 type IV pilus modification protein PilV [Shewanella sedimentimangrovi]
MKYSRNGFSLIEVLVSLVILVIGLIGIFNLHTVAKQSNFESFQQTQASYYASDIVSRMKLNRTELANYAGTYDGTMADPGISCDVAVGANVICTNAQTRAWDLYQWGQLFIGSAEETAAGNFVGGLDSPIACINVNNATGDVTVVMTWRGIRKASDGGANAADSFVKDCGKKGDARRRIFVLSTAII